MSEIMSTFGRPVSSASDQGVPVAYIPLEDILGSGDWMDSEEYARVVGPVVEAGGDVAFVCRGGVRSRLAAEVAEGRDGVEGALNFEGGQEVSERGENNDTHPPFPAEGFPGCEPRRGGREREVTATNKETTFTTQHTRLQPR